MQKVIPQYRNLQQHLDTLPVGFPETESGVEIRILQYLFTPEEAEIALNLNIMPTPAEKIHNRMKKPKYSVQELEEKLDKIADKGGINRHVKRNGLKLFSNALLAIGMYEFQVNRMTKEFYSDFLQYLDEAFRDEVLRTRIPQLRTIPTEGAIAPDLPIMTYDNIRDIISTYKGPIAVANCICKQGKDLLGDPCHQTKMREICFTFGSSARKFVEEGLGRSISKEQTFEILKQAEKDSLVLQPSNTEVPFCLCLCCGCCCEILTSAKPLDKPVQYFATNYYAVVDRESCIGCGTCEKRCQMDAISIIDKKSVVDYERCIGCGLCVVTCAKNAIKLEQIKHPRVPPKNGVKLYMNILRKKIGNARYIIMITKQLFGNKV